jgi:Flp pilus assembly pilin Flp
MDALTVKYILIAVSLVLVGLGGQVRTDVLARAWTDVTHPVAEAVGR